MLERMWMQTLTLKDVLPVVIKRKRVNPLVISYTILICAMFAAGFFAEDYNQRVVERRTTGFNAPTALVFYNMPRMEMTMASPGGSSEHVKITLSLQVMRKNMARLEDYQPRISDGIIRFLRAQDIEDIRQPSYSPQLRKSLLAEVNKADGNQVPVSDVVFQEFLVQ